jgi:hypothetical protein
LKNTFKSLMNATLVVAALSLTAGCSSSGSTGAGGGAGGGTGGGTGGAGGGTTSDGGTTTTCASYCTSIQANCVAATDGGASVGQYPGVDACLGSCAAFVKGDAGAMAGNNLECRAYHAGAAPADRTLHCPHAGPAGDGTCGANCDGFCAIAQTACTGANQAFADSAACMTACNAFTGVSAHYNSASTSGNSFNCRMYHLTVAASSTANATTHCPHIKAVSTTCL